MKILADVQGTPAALKAIIRQTLARKPPAPKPDRPPHNAASVVIITGASSGIGRCAAGLFAQHGWRVGLIARGEPGLKAARGDVQRQGAMAATAQADVTDSDALEAAAAQIEQALGPVDVWVNCAGNGTYGRFLDTPAEDFRRVTDVTYLGTVNGTRVALRRMLPRDQGCVVNVCSAAAFHGMPLLSSYSGAKHAVRGFGQSICAELTQDRSKVRLTTIFPPAVNTPFFEHAVSHMGRPGRPMVPVYQPEIVAQVIHLATMTNLQEISVSFTTILFSLCVRLCPGLIGQAIRRLGYEGQLCERTISLVSNNTTLFAPSDHASPIHGAFNAEARSSSVHVRILTAMIRLSATIRRSPPAGSATPPGCPLRNAARERDLRTIVPLGVSLGPDPHATTAGFSDNGVPKPLSSVSGQKGG